MILGYPYFRKPPNKNGMHIWWNMNGCTPNPLSINRGWLGVFPKLNGGFLMGISIDKRWTVHYLSVIVSAVNRPPLISGIINGSVWSFWRETPKQILIFSGVIVEFVFLSSEVTVTQWPPLVMRSDLHLKKTNSVGFCFSIYLFRRFFFL